MQEILFNETAPLPFAPPVEGGQRKRATRKDSKKNRILELHRAGTADIGEIARQVGTRPSYVAGVLQSAGLIQGYFDLYTTTARDQNTYSRFFRNVLSFKTVERIAQLYKYFERIGDRAGQHHAEVLALTGRNRARFSGKKEEAQVFEE